MSEENQTQTIETGATPANRTAQAYHMAAQMLAASLDADAPVVALSQDIKLHDLQGYLKHPVRQKGEFHTASLDDFCTFIIANTVGDHGVGSVLLIDEEPLGAKAILDFGNRQAPGHKQLRAHLLLQDTLQLKKFGMLIGKLELNQRELAEFIEDHFVHCEFYRDNGDALEVLDTKAVLKAIRSVDAERIKRSNSSVQPLSASASTFEQITISDATASLPTRMVFTCAWCYGLPEVSISTRVRVLTDDGDKVSFSLDAIDLHAAKRESAQSLQRILRERLAEQAIDTYLGQFKA